MSCTPGFYFSMKGDLAITKLKECAKYEITMNNIKYINQFQSYSYTNQWANETRFVTELCPQ